MYFFLILIKKLIMQLIQRNRALLTYYYQQKGSIALHIVCMTVKMSTYHRDVPASIFGVAHYIVPQVS